MSIQRVAIAGATGYTGEELIRILLKHPAVQLTHLAASAKWERPTALAELFPGLGVASDLHVTALDSSALADSADTVFLALPHGVSMDVVPALLDAGCTVIDLGGDFRLKDPAVFQRWYGKPHTHPELLGQAVYGLTELFRASLPGAALVANPGCYATSVILASAPLVKAGMVDGGLIVDAKSGRSGAGRQTVSDWERSGKAEDLWPYKVNAHQHVPEVGQALSQAYETVAPSITFVPHVVPMHRGLLSTVFVRTTKPMAREAVAGLFRGLYDGEPFVRLLPSGQWPTTQSVVGTNFCDIGLAVDEGERLVIVVAAIDNLVKGAAGQAVQNFNVMAGLAETTGLIA